MMRGRVSFGYSAVLYCHISQWLLRVAASVVLIASLQAASAGAPPAMTVPGSFSVGQAGDAAYSIPIAVPPGTSGLQPELALAYSSQGGDGIVGLGWILSGLPLIERCPRTLAQDGVHGGVNYDSNDRFCVGGQRLVAVSGTYGANGTSYRTEVDSFDLFESYGTSGNGPAYFRMRTKSGQILEFGNTADSRILAVGKTTARAWAVNKISDAKGNYLTVSYTNDMTNGQVYPSRIDYTGNANANVTPYNSIQFSYTTRSDVVPTYQAGSLQQNTVLLSHIKTYRGSSVVNDYQLGYRAGTSTQRSRLTSVTLCDSSGVCLPPTTLGWQGGSDALTMTGTSTNLAQGSPSLAAGEFNGDGLTDAIIGNATYCGIFSGTQSGAFVDSGIQARYTYTVQDPEKGWTTYEEYYGPACFTLSFFPLTNTRTARPKTIDFGGDGLTDLIVPVKMLLQPKEYHFLHNNGQGELAEFDIESFGVGDFGDVDGDGRTDILASTATGAQWYLSNGTSSFGTGPSLTGTSFAVGDFDGNGCADTMVFASANSVSYSCAPAVSSATFPTQSTDASMVFGDFNGDGKTDVLVVKPNAAGSLYLSTGTGFVLASFAVPSDWGKYTVYAGDWNRDGKIDIVLVADGKTGHYGVGTSHSIWLSTGSGFVQATTISNTNSADTSVTAVIADWNSDGADDIWLKKASGDVLYTFAYVPELLTTISNGIGATTTVTYDRLNKNGTFYVKGTGASYPIQDLNGPRYYVKQMAVSNGIGGNYTTTYSYAGAKSDLRGRGFLGFSSTTSTDTQTGVTQTTNYRTDFPFVGRVSSQVATANGVTLSSTTNTYADTNEGTSTEGVVRHFVMLTQSVTSGHDLDGTALPTATTSYNYDGYGNALTVNTSVSDGSSKNATNTYSNDTTHWFLGRLTYTSVTSTVGSSSITRTSCFQYDSASGLLTREVIEPVSSSNCTYSSTGVQTDYTYDSFGHRITATVSGSGITTRSSSAGYDALGQFQTSATNALSQSESWAYDARFGLPASHTGPNGLTTSWTYDTFGHPTLETRPDGNRTATSYAYCSGVNGGSASCVSYGAFITTVTPQNASGSQNGPQSIATYDSLSRGIASDAQGFDGSWIRSATQYDSFGRVARTSRPYFVSGGTPKWTVNTYDALGRATRTDFPNGGYTTFGYHGLTASTTNNLGQTSAGAGRPDGRYLEPTAGQGQTTSAASDNSQTTTTVKNAQGLVASVTDALNHTTSYVYDAVGNLKTVTDPSGNVITNTYDTRGNKTASSDPDMGNWSYGYNVLGQLTSQTDAKNQTSTLSYDVLGRLTGATEGAFTRAYTYDTASHGVGRLASASSSGASTLLIEASADVYNGNPLAQVAVNGTVVGTYEVSAVRASGAWQTLTIPGDFSNAQSVSISFTNDTNGGSADKDRNLIIRSITLGGKTFSVSASNCPDIGIRSDGSCVMLGNITVTYTVPSTASTLLIEASADVYNGNPIAQIAVDGTVVGTYEVSVLHSSGAWQTLSIQGNYSNARSISVSFTNDAFGGTADTDRNLIIRSITLGGKTFSVSASNCPDIGIRSDGSCVMLGNITVTYAVQGNATVRGFTYDSLGRPSTMTLTTGGATHTYTDTYNANGQLNTVAYPSGFTAQYVYDGYGYITQIKDNSTGTAYWTANTRDAELHLLSQTFGNGVSQTNSFDANTGFLTNVRAGPNNTVANFDYTYDTLGNLTYRADGYAGTFEYACYDALNRLTQYAVGNGVTACTSSQNAKTVGYDALGNITSKTGVGTYSYPAAGQARPHAVSSITGTVNGAVNPAYTYDANGNMTAGAGRTVTYTSFNMAASIVQGSTTVGFTYDSEHQRVQMTGPSGTTTYINDTGSGAMSEKQVLGSTTTWHDYLLAGGKIIAEKFSGGTTAMRYFVSDHLASVAVVMNETGTAVERNAFDAWGKRRNLNGSDDTTCSLTSQTTRGYTGHEQIDAACLINANARIYDPAIGRFMAADSIVPDVFDGQSFNRYSYVGNRPLSLTDPAGHAAACSVNECVDGPGEKPKVWGFKPPSVSLGAGGGGAVGSLSRGSFSFPTKPYTPLGSLIPRTDTVSGTWEFDSSTGLGSVSVPSLGLTVPFADAGSTAAAAYAGAETRVRTTSCSGGECTNVGTYVLGGTNNAGASNCSGCYQIAGPPMAQGSAGASNSSGIPTEVPDEIPGGPYSAAGRGQAPGTFLGPKQESGPRTTARWVPSEDAGGPPGSKGYWKVQYPGQRGWSRFGQNGEPMTPQEAHPNPRPAPSVPWAGPLVWVAAFFLFMQPAE